MNFFHICVIILTIGFTIPWSFARTGDDHPKRSETSPSQDATLWRKTNTFIAPDPSTLKPESDEMVHLGRALFFDNQLSANQQISCASCHQPEKFFTDGLPTAVGLKRGKRNTPTIVNVRWLRWLFWDGRADSLEAQALGPIENHLEQGTHRYYIHELIAQRYKKDYERLFGDIKPILRKHKQPLGVLTSSESDSQEQLASIKALRPHQWAALFAQLTNKQKRSINQTFLNIARAIAAYERTIIALASDFDRFMNRWKGQGSPEIHTDRSFNLLALQGLRLFVGKAQCHLCHNGPLLTDQEFYNTGLPSYEGIQDQGRATGITKWQDSEFSCHADIMQGITHISKSETCIESRYLKLDSKEWQGAFRTPSLRNLEKTAPYGHQGQFPDLNSMLEHYNQGKFLSPVGHSNPLIQPLNLTRKEKEAILAFLKTLNSVTFNQDPSPSK